MFDDIFVTMRPCDVSSSIAVCARTDSLLKVGAYSLCVLHELGAGSCGRATEKIRKRKKTSEGNRERHQHITINKHPLQHRILFENIQRLLICSRVQRGELQ